MNKDESIRTYIILTKLNHQYEERPEFANRDQLLDSGSPQRQWISEVKALLKKDREISCEEFNFRNHCERAERCPNDFDEIKMTHGIILDAINKLKLHLELNGEHEIGKVYDANKQYDFFRDLKEIINSAKNRIFIIDPYFNEKSFNTYLSEVSSNVKINVLSSKLDNLQDHIAKHQEQHQSNITLKKTRNIHDRIIFIDNDTCWIVGGSIKDAGKKPTYLIPLYNELVGIKSSIYEEIWDKATTV